jgi:hypothetical protein
MLPECWLMLIKKKGKGNKNRYKCHAKAAFRVGRSFK